MRGPMGSPVTNQLISILTLGLQVAHAKYVLGILGNACRLRAPGKVGSTRNTRSSRLKFRHFRTYKSTGHLCTNFLWCLGNASNIVIPKPVFSHMPLKIPRTKPRMPHIIILKGALLHGLPDFGCAALANPMRTHAESDGGF